MEMVGGSSVDVNDVRAQVLGAVRQLLYACEFHDQKSTKTGTL